MQVQACPETQSFVNFLLCVGSGTWPTVTVGAHSDYIEIPNIYLFKPDLAGDLPERQLIMAVYPGIREGQLQVNSLCEHSILTALNSDVHLLNNLATDMLTGSACKYTAVDESLDGTVATENMNCEDPIEVGPFRL